MQNRHLQIDTNTLATIIEAVINCIPEIKRIAVDEYIERQQDVEALLDEADQWRRAAGHYRATLERNNITIVEESDDE